MMKKLMSALFQKRVRQDGLDVYYQIEYQHAKRPSELDFLRDLGRNPDYLRMDS